MSFFPLKIGKKNTQKKVDPEAEPGVESLFGSSDEGEADAGPNSEKKGKWSEASF